MSNNIFDLNEILNQKRRQAEIAHEHEIEELKEQLRYILLRLEQLYYNYQDDLLPTEKELRIRLTLRERFWRLFSREDK